MTTPTRKDSTNSLTSSLTKMPHTLSATQILQSWKNLLPENAVVMARVRPPSVSVEPPQEISASSGPDSHARICEELTGCPRCKLCTARKNVVVGEGDVHARLVFVGEGPGEQEDIEGRPFVGKAGELLDKMIEAIGLRRDQVYICNVVKCRPPGNRNPEPDEIAACRPFLYRQLELIQPTIVVALGKFAAQTLLQTEEKISDLRGKFRPHRTWQLMPTWHPAYLLRNPPAKREAWEDLKKVAEALGLQIPARK